MIVLIALLLGTATSIAAPNSNNKCIRVYRVGTNLPAVSKDRAGLENIGLEIFNEIKKRAGCGFDERPMSFARGAEELRLNLVDMYAFAYSVPELLEIASTEIVYSLKRILLVNAKHYKPGYTVKDYLKDPKIKFATISGGLYFTSTPELKELQKADRILFDPFPDGVLQQVAQEKVQAAFTSPTYYAVYVKKYGLDTKTKLIVDTENLELVLYFSRKRISSQEQEKFRKVIRSMKQDGSIRKILEKYVPKKDLDTYYTF